MKQQPVIHRQVARVLLFDQQDRLLLLFDPDPDRGGYWYPPGGRIEDGESPEEAARRELAEEVGLDVAEVCDNGPPTEPWMIGALDDK
jgi:8-oxo-dGTP pyrophosphatase MutT (NUDIX family)